MRRLVIILLLFVVPFQGAWAGAARYCLEGDGGGQPHFGHHLHIDVGDDESAFPKSPVHGDCVACHLVSMHAVFASGLSLIGAMPLSTIKFPPIWRPFESRPAAVPERPKWHRLANQ